MLWFAYNGSHGWMSFFPWVTLHYITLGTCHLGEPTNVFDDQCLHGSKNESTFSVFIYVDIVGEW